ncbi:4'-phosphopantetheinyl transferase family protein [Undibacterium luofuense]|uniref:4'-phosphopantetheinyl transferase family protein n=1 Tax=Undibacterium luofuense TaxID=2828733 RepID=UPI0030EECEE7
MTARIFFRTGVFRQQDFETGFALLDDAERQRCLQYQHLNDKLRFACTRIALKRLLADCLQTTADSIRISTTKQGQPFYPHQNTRWTITVSHTEQHYLIAVTDADIAIGADLESYENSAAFSADMLGSFCHPQEINSLNNLPADHHLMHVQQLWSAKEAIVKALATGFHTDPCTLLLPVPVPEHCAVSVSKQTLWLSRQTLMISHDRLMLTRCASTEHAEWIGLPVSGAV